MATLTVRITEEAHAVLRELARESGRSMQAVLAEAIENARRNRVLDRTNAAYAKLRRNKQAWVHVKDERNAWDATLTDGLGK